MRSIVVVLALALVAAHAMPIADEVARAAAEQPQSQQQPAAANFTGYIVTGQWDGRTIPSPQWAFEITRQDTAFRFNQQLKLATLIPTTAGDGLTPSFTSYDANTRAYFMTTARNAAVASLWGFTLSGDVSAAAPVNAEVRYSFPADGATLVGLQVFPTPSASERTWESAFSANALTVLAFFNTLQGNCTVLSVDYTTGNTEVWLDDVCSLGANTTDPRALSTAIDRIPGTNTVFAVTGATEGAPAYAVVTLDVSTKAYTQQLLAPLKNFDPTEESPFELQWIPSLNQLIVFFTGNFDTLLWVDPATGATSFAISDLAEYQGAYGGNLEFTADDFLEDDDTWTDSAYDSVNKQLYFQCSDTDPDSGEVTIAMCQLPITAKVEPFYFVNIAIEPMTYGYVGFEYIQIAK